MVTTTTLVGEQLFVAGSLVQLSVLAGAVGGVSLAALAVHRDRTVVSEEEPARATRPSY